MINEIHLARRHKLWETHSHKMLIAFVIALITSSSLLVYGVYNLVIARSESTIDFIALINSLTANPNANPFSLPVLQSDQTQFDLPISYMNWTLPITVNLTLTNNIAFVQNTLSRINVTTSFSNVGEQAEAVTIEQIQVRPVDAINSYPNPYSLTGYENYGYSYPCYIFPYMSTNTTTNQTWSGASYGVFQNTGTVTLEIQVLMMPSASMQNKIYSYLTQNNQRYQYSYDTNLTLPNIFIISESQLTEQQRAEQQQDIQQRGTSLQIQLQALQLQLLAQEKNDQNNSQTMNIGLTCIILFFASLDIAVITYDHSEDEDRKAQYYAEKKEQEYYDDIL